MKRFAAILLVLALLMSVALAESVSSVNTYVERQGYKPASVKNKSGLMGCWFVEGDTADTLQWSDRSRIYTVTDSVDAGLWLLYADILEMAEWDTCTYTAAGRVQFAYNAADANAVKDYKTLKNYIRYVGEYLNSAEPTQQQAAAPKSGRQTYIVNKSSKKFHLESCPTVSRMKKQNKERYTGNRNDLIAQGYDPCKKCNP